MNSGNEFGGEESVRNSTSSVIITAGQGQPQPQLVCASSIVDFDGEVEVETEKGESQSGEREDEFCANANANSELHGIEGEGLRGRGRRKRCLVCLDELCSEGLMPRPEEKEELPLVTFCSLLKVRIPPAKTKSLQTLDTPLCLKCGGEVAKIKSLLEEIEKLEGSIRATRVLIKDTVLKCSKEFECEDVGEKEDGSPTASEIVRAINNIRINIMQADMMTGPTIHKTPGRKPGKKRKEDPEFVRDGVEPISNIKSSFGRVVKRPRYLATSVSDEDSEDEEKKFDPDHHQEETPTIPVKTEVHCDAELGEIKTDAVPSDDSVATGSNKYSKVETISVSEAEFQLSLSDSNWSDDDLSDGEDDKNLSRNPAKRKRKLKQKTKKGNIKYTQVQLVGANGENLGGGVVKDGKVMIDYNPHKAVAGFQEAVNAKDVFTKKSRNKPKKKIECKKCKRTFMDEAKMERHVSKMHRAKEEDYSCKSCNKTFAKSSDLKIHKRTEHGMKQHTVDEDGRKIFECEFCKTVFKNGSDLLIHRRRHTGEQPFKCHTCEKGFISKGKYEAHVEVTHPGVPPLKCEFCPRSFFRHHRLRDHQKSHTGERPYLCEICSKSFSQPAYLKYHQTQHKELNLEEYKCVECDKTFATPVNLKYHKETQHQGKYRYYCDVCGHGATHMSHMKLHKRSHTGERPHCCGECGKSYTRPAQLKIHMRSHTGERPYYCKSCGKTFTNSSKLRRHEVTHSVLKRPKNIKGKILSTTSQQPESSSDINTLIPQQLVDVHIGQDNNGQPVLKMEPLQPAEEEQGMQRQLIRIEQPNGITYQVIAANESGNSNETYAEYIVLNGDFTIG